jgi:hypothetical protein
MDQAAGEGDIMASDECSRRAGKRDALRGLVKKGIKPLGKTASLVGSKIKSRSPLRASNSGSQSSDGEGGVVCRDNGCPCGDPLRGAAAGLGHYKMDDDVVLFGDVDMISAHSADNVDAFLLETGDSGSMDDVALVAGGVAATCSDSDLLLGSSYSPVPSPPSSLSMSPSPFLMRAATAGSEGLRLSSSPPLSHSLPGSAGTLFFFAFL